LQRPRPKSRMKLNLRLTAFAKGFVPAGTRSASLTYIRLSSFQCLSSAIETAVSSATRSLDKPDVPLIISSVKFAVNTLLDLLVILKFHVGTLKPSVNTQASIRLACDLSSAFVGVIYFVYATTIRPQSSAEQKGATIPSLRGLKILLRPGIIMFLQSAIRNALYLWLVHGIVSMCSDYATAWGVFNPIRWGLVMVPVQALEATSLAFIGHAWGRWRREMGVESRKPKMSRRHLTGVVKPALTSLIIALIVEVPLCIFLAIFGCRPFASYLSGSATVAGITAYVANHRLVRCLPLLHSSIMLIFEQVLYFSTQHRRNSLQYCSQPDHAGTSINRFYPTFSTSFLGRLSARYQT